MDFVVGQLGDRSTIRAGLFGYLVGMEEMKLLQIGASSGFFGLNVRYFELDAGYP